MDPVILKTKEVLEKDKKLAQEKVEENHIFRRNSRSLDKGGRYRIKTKPSLFYTKCLASLILSFLALYPLFDSQPFDEYIRLFYESDRSVIHMNFVQGAAATTFSWYLFETVAISQYYKIQWSVILHHWLTAIAALSVMLGYFLPAAILYGILLVAFVWPVSLLTAFKLQYGFKYPNFTRKAYKFVYRYFVVMIVLCIAMQIVMLYNGFMKGAYSIEYALIIVCCCIAWCYDDLNAARAIKQGENLNYEILDFDELTK